jgi:hypothetical protein
MTCKLCSINHFLVFTDLKYSFLSIYGNNGRSDLNGEENIVLTGNDPPFAPLVGKMVFLLACSFSGFQHKSLLFFYIKTTFNNYLT